MLLLAPVPELNVTFPVPLIAPLTLIVAAVVVPKTIEVLALSVTAEPMIWPLLLAVMEGAVPPSAIVPPERVMAPEPEAKTSLLASTVPVRAMEPVASPVAALPKFKVLLVVVVTFPGSVAPVASVLQPCVASPVVGAAQVPAAVPKPGVAPSLSQ